jgi:uncharacterized membrane protein
MVFLHLSKRGIFLLDSLVKITCFYNNVPQCANMAWLVKGFGGLLLLILHSFYRQKVLVVL